MAEIISTAKNIPGVKEKETGKPPIVDTSGNLEISTSNLVPNRRPLEKKDVDEFIKKKKASLKIKENKSEDKTENKPAETEAKKPGRKKKK